MCDLYYGLFLIDVTSRSEQDDDEQTAPLGFYDSDSEVYALFFTCARQWLIVRSLARSRLQRYDIVG